MKYTLTGTKKKLQFSNHYDFVRWMRKSDIQYWDSNREFMEHYSHRKYFLDKTVLRYGNERKFVEDLVESNLLMIEGKQTKAEIFTEKLFYTFRTILTKN